MLVLVADQADSARFTGTSSYSIHLTLRHGHDRCVACDRVSGSVLGQLGTSTTGTSPNLTVEIRMLDY